MVKFVYLFEENLGSHTHRHSGSTSSVSQELLFLGETNKYLKNCYPCIHFKHDWNLPRVSAMNVRYAHNYRYLRSNNDSHYGLHLEQCHPSAYPQDLWQHSHVPSDRTLPSVFISTNVTKPPPLAWNTSAWSQQQNVVMIIIWSHRSTIITPDLFQPRSDRQHGLHLRWLTPSVSQGTKGLLA